MPVLGSAVASASMSPFPAPGTHTFEIKEVEYKQSDDSGSAGFQFKLKVVASDDKPEAVGRTFFMYINVLKKDGEPNEMGGGDVRKIVAAAVSKEASADPEFDTDNLIGTTFVAKLTVTVKDDQEQVRLTQHQPA